MAFDVAGEAYGRFMGRYSEPLGPVFAEWAGVRRGDRVLDVGCGPGALTAALVERVGVGDVATVDPSAPFVESVRARFPGLEVHRAPAEQLPFDDAAFDAALAQLVVHFMQDPVMGLREMARVTARGGVVAACTWDLGGHRSPLDPFWTAVRRIDRLAPDESHLAGVREGHLAELATEAGLHDVESAELTVCVTHADFDEWWEPYTLGVGPAGDHVASLGARDRDALREECRSRFPEAGPFTIEAVAWAVRGRA